MTTNIFPANLQWFGIAKETTYGTPAAAPTWWIPMISPAWKPTRVALPDEALRGSMAQTYQQQQGQGYDEFTYQTLAYLDTIFPHFMAALGSPDVPVGSSAPYTHATALQNGSVGGNAQPPSYTVWYYDAAGKCWQSAGCKSSNLKIDAKPDGLVTIDAGWMGLPAVAVTPPANTPGQLAPMPGYTTVISIGGVPISKYSEVSLTYKRATEYVPTITGSQTPVAIFAGPLAVTGDLTGVYQGSTDNDLAAFLTNAQPGLTVHVANAGDAVNGLTLQHSQIAYDVSAISGTNKWMEVKSTIKALANATDALSGSYSPAKATLVNSASTAY